MPWVRARAVLRPRSKVLPEYARGHNRALVLQTPYCLGGQSRADVARATGLAQVTVSDLVAELIAEGFVIQLGQREDVRPGKPVKLLDVDRSGFQIVGIDLSDYRVFRGVILDLDGQILSRSGVELENSTGEDVTTKVITLVGTLLAQATTAIIGIAIGSLGIVDLDGVVLSAPNLGWANEPLRARVAECFPLPVVLSNDANDALLAQHKFGDANSDIMLIKIGHGLGSGLLLAGTPFFGSRFTAGEIGHVVVGTCGDECVCGERGCLETWLAVPRIEARLGLAGTEGRSHICDHRSEHIRSHPAASRRSGRYKQIDDKTLAVSSSAPPGQPPRRGRSAPTTRPLAPVPSATSASCREH